MNIVVESTALAVVNKPSCRRGPIDEGIAMTIGANEFV